MALNIVTHGSCLSRYIARSYKRLYAGEIISSVYHNRSDYFVKCFLNHTGVPIDSFLGGDLGQNSCKQTDDDGKNIIINQTLLGIGRHKIDREMNLFKTIENYDINLIFIDNFMDVAARLSCGIEREFFLRPGDYINYDKHFVLGDYLSIEDSVRNNNLIVDFYLKSCPNSKIFFFHFPFNTYKNDKLRAVRSMKFYEKFHNENIKIVPPQSVPSIYQTDVPSHFQEPQYAAYAGMVRVLMNI